MENSKIKVNQNIEFREICEAYRSSKRFIEFTNSKNNMLHEEGVLREEVLQRKKIIFDFECSIALLDEDYHKILSKELSNDNSLWYVGLISRSTYYRNRQKAIEVFLKNYHRLEVL